MAEKTSQLPLFPKRPYSQPAPPAEYAKVASPLADEDANWLKKFDRQFWKETAPDRFGHKTALPEGKIAVEDLNRVFELIRCHKLLTTMGCGTFGLMGYSMTVWEHPSVPGLEPTPLLTLSDDHLPPPPKEAVMEHGENGENKAGWQLAWDSFSQFTHSVVNKEMLSLYHGKTADMRFEPSRERSHYDY